MQLSGSSPTAGQAFGGHYVPPLSSGPSPAQVNRPAYTWLPRVAARPKSRRADSLMQMLGWFGIGLGVAQLLAPRRVAQAVGVDDHPLVLRALGVREVASGVGILTQPRPAGWGWARVAGDIMDITLLGIAARGWQSARRKRKLALAAAAVGTVTALDIIGSLRQTRPAQATANEIDIEQSIVINRSPEQCYRYWRDFSRFPRFMHHVEEVRALSDKVSHWRVKAPFGTVEWDAELSVDHPNQLLAWHSVGNPDVDNAGTVRFEAAPGGRGTIVRVELQYKPPAGRPGAIVAKLLGEEPAQQLNADLRRFKQLIEAGEIPTTEGQPSGPRSFLVNLLFRRPGEQR